MKSRENTEKTGFSGIFPAFSAGIFFSKIGFPNIWALPFCIIVLKIRKTNEPISSKAGNRRTDVNGQRLTDRTSR